MIIYLPGAWQETIPYGSIPTAKAHELFDKVAYAHPGDVPGLLVCCRRADALRDLYFLFRGPVLCCVSCRRILRPDQFGGDAVCLACWRRHNCWV